MLHTSQTNPVTGLSRVWHRHRLLMNDGTTVQIRVDIGFPHKSFRDFPHLLILRNHDEADDQVIVQNIRQVAQESLLYLGCCVFTGNYEWCFWCDDAVADALERSGGEELADEVFFMENDLGDYFRTLLIPSDFTTIAESNLALCLSLQEEDIEIPAKHKVRHWLQLDDKDSLSSFLAAVEAMGFRLEYSEDVTSGVRVCILESNNLEVETRHHSVAILFDLAERVSGRHEGWEVDLA